MSNYKRNKCFLSYLLLDYLLLDKKMNVIILQVCTSIIFVSSCIMRSYESLLRCEPLMSWSMSGESIRSDYPRPRCVNRKSTKCRGRAGSDSSQYWLGLLNIKFTSNVNFFNNSETLVNRCK